ncbi:hypothetical protein [Massilia pseudoviolaceinigra]|uniref:hypothetical protein n=1 Tax=Massilia pseudoviolaceinigra TaxID=3057165 RepID=UPI002796BA84|nr:hypothetical protein [Massilia sp. CCM 9206]MDQ1918733.1 hypothetical protein [Massilia sp. CCM 9206]
MKTFVDKEDWLEIFSGYQIVAVAVQDSTTVHFCARQKIPPNEASLLFDSQIPTRVITLLTKNPPGSNCGYEELHGMTLPVVGVSRVPFPQPSGMVSSRNADGDIWPHGRGISGPLEFIKPGSYPSPRRLKCLNGFTYSVGVARSVYKRIEVSKWIKIQEGFPNVEGTTKHGFIDIDAFSDTDMYAVGGHGDVWHFDGLKWSQLDFPSNVQLGTVTCAGDGNIYISGEGGSLWVSQKSTWKSIYLGGSSILWNDALWFRDKLWLASDYQLRCWNGKELESVVHDGKSVPIYGHMDAYDGLLVVASPDYAMSFDGETWRNLVGPY